MPNKDCTWLHIIMYFITELLKQLWQIEEIKIFFFL